MKTVVNSKQVAHLWANQSQSHARNAGNTLYFEGNKIFSYGSHFCIARIDKEKDVILYTSRDYSSTTHKHKRYVLGSLSAEQQKKVIVIPDPAPAWDDHAPNAKLMEKAILKVIAEGERARERAKYLLQDAENKIEQLYNYTTAYKLSKIPCFDLSKLKARVAIQRIKSEEKEKLRLQQKGIFDSLTKKFLPDMVKAWRERKEFEPIASEGVQFKSLQKLFGNPFHSIKTEICRLSSDKTEIETSKGANVSLDDARRAVGFIRAKINAREDYQTNGHTFHVGSFQLDSIHTETRLVKIGCHTFSFDEVEQVENLLKA